MDWMLGFSAVGSLPVLFALGRKQDRVLTCRFDHTLTPRGENLYSSLARRVAGDLELAVVTYTEAFSVRKEGYDDAAVRLLDAAHCLVERSAPAMVRLLAGMATFSRQVEAIDPMPSLRARAFRLFPLALLAGLGSILDKVLVSSGERFRLRVYLLGHGYGLAARCLLRDSERMIRRGSWTPAEWARIEAIHGDFETLTGELLGSLRSLLSSLSAADRT